MTLKQLEYVITAADCGSLSGAAEKLGIEETEIYDAVAGLELSLDIGIFIPTQRGLALTPEGKELIAQARQILSQVSRIEDKFLNHNGERRLCTVSCQHYAFAAQAMGELAKALGGSFEFSLNEESLDEIIEDVRDMKSEVGLIHLTDVNEKAVMKKLNEARLVFHPLFDTVPMVLMSENTADRVGTEETVGAKQLKGLTLVCYIDSRDAIFDMMPELDQPYTESRQIIVSDRSALGSLLRETGGYSLTAEELEEPGIVSMPLDTEEMLMIGWIEDTRGRLSDIARSYIHFLKRVISDKGFEMYEDE